MATWFDRDRGLRSGRIKPAVATPAEGEHVFVLGAEALDELAILTDGDYTEVRQRVDLTGYDLVAATMEAIGTVMGVAQPLAGFPELPVPLFWFDFNVGSEIVPNRVEDGFQLAADGSIEVGTETYSPNGQYCRVIPEGVGQARMLGENTPQAFPATPLENYTFQFWLNFDTSVYASSTGIGGRVFSVDSTLGKLIFYIEGITASHEWYFRVQHANNLGGAHLLNIDGFLIDAPLGWKLFTIRYRKAQSPPNQLQLFMNDTLVGAATVAVLIDTTQPSPGAEIFYGNPEIVGGYDAMRLLDYAMSDGEIAASYNACITNPSAVNYQWVMEILFDGVLYAQRVIDSDEHRIWEDFSAPCRLLVGETEVAFRLKLEQLP